MSKPTEAGNGTIRVKLVRSVNGTQSKHRLCVRALGLGKLNSVSELKDIPSVRGLINKVRYMVAVVD